MLISSGDALKSGTSCFDLDWNMLPCWFHQLCFIGGEGCLKLGIGFPHQEMSNDKKPWLFVIYVGDEKLPSCIGIAINHYFIRIPINQPVYWNVIRGFFIAHMVTMTD